MYTFLCVLLLAYGCTWMCCVRLHKPRVRVNVSVCVPVPWLGAVSCPLRAPGLCVVQAQGKAQVRRGCSLYISEHIGECVCGGGCGRYLCHRGVCMCAHVWARVCRLCHARPALPSPGLSPLPLPGLLSQSLEFSSPADNYTVCEGDNATLSCFIDEHVTRVAWLNRSNILYAGNDRWTSDARVRLLINTPEEFSILITQVGLGDEGLYTCSFQTRHQPYTTQVYLIVHVPARIVNISSPVTVNEGGSVNLLCLAVGRPEPTVTWRQLRDGFTSEGEILEISDIQRGQA
ncbi:igLON family member 5, partial [Fukomys damarensis]|uniref:igLON family member 5 n=1 Tax=Fukomys damarensis TaxID=885580 RepID=UPI001455BAE7